MELLITLAEALQSIPPQLATLLLATIPIGELRGALPVALTVYDLPILEAVFWSILGNMLPVYALLLFFEVTARWLRTRSELADRLLDKVFERTRHKLEDKVQKYGPLALTLFVSVPLPVTGAWTGTLAAFVFGIPKKKAFFAILGGILIASVVVTIITLGTSFTISKIF